MKTAFGRDVLQDQSDVTPVCVFVCLIALMQDGTKIKIC